jgi:hypothetical protein
MSHTPAPWKYSDEGEVAWVSPSNQNENVICDIVGRSWNSETKTSQITDEDIDNARLIAAAPELLEALITSNTALMLSYHGRDIPDNIHRIVEENRILIAKTTGKHVPA